MLTRKEVSKRLKAKAKAKDRGGKSLHIYIPESMYTEKTDGGGKFRMVKLLEETPYKVVLLEKNSIHCKGKCRV